MSAPGQYGPRIAAVAVYLWHGQLLSRHRTCEAIGELFGVRVSPGAVTGMVSRAAAALGACLEAQPGQRARFDGPRREPAGR